MRSNNELIWQSLILLSNANQYAAYVEEHDFSVSERNWHRLFGRGRLLSKISKLESHLGFDDKTLDQLASWRREMHHTYSHATHHSYVAVSTGAFSWKDDSGGLVAEDLVYLSGKASDVERVLQDLITQLWYLLTMMVAVLALIHKVELDIENDKWFQFMSIFNAASLLYEHFYSSDILAPINNRDSI